jgi:hypothetical protein
MSQNKERERTPAILSETPSVSGDPHDAHDARPNYVESRPNRSDMAGSSCRNPGRLLVSEGAAAGPRSAQTACGAKAGRT